jgi:hypothetical protein
MPQHEPARKTPAERTARGLIGIGAVLIAWLVWRVVVVVLAAVTGEHGVSLLPLLVGILGVGLLVAGLVIRHGRR